MNVAAYCRVSTDNDDQLNSLDNQTSFFYEYIQRNPKWSLVAIYSDEGVTGTSVEKRVQFNKMIADAKAGKIDLIITKEVSRFARNTVDTLSYTRELRNIGVGVYFINDNINTLENDGEFRLSIMASVAQEESRKTSARVKWGMKRQMEKGFVFSPPMLGYESVGGQLTVNQEEAKIVRYIYDLYVNQNLGTVSIAKRLAAENVPLSKRIKCWSPTAVMRILSNEKYVGDLIQQKTMVVDYLSHKSVDNNGDKLYFKDHHDAIVDRHTWNEAQRIRKLRALDPNKCKSVNHSKKYWCSGKIECGTCHGQFVSKTKKAVYDTIRVYRCKHTAYYKNEIGECTNKTYIDERVLKACMKYAISKIIIDADEIKRKVIHSMQNKHPEIELEKRIETLESKKKKAFTLLLDDVVSKDDYQAMVSDINSEILLINKQLEDIRITSLKLNNNIISHCIDEYLNQTKPTEEIYGEILNKIVVYDDMHVDIYFQNIDLPFSVKYSRKGRGAQYVVQCEDFEHNITG